MIDTIRRAIFAGSVAGRWIRDSYGDRSLRHTIEGPPESIVLMGGEMFNKGAQAMTFTTVDQFKRLFPEVTVYLLSTRDYNRPEDEKACYDFEILPWTRDVQFQLLIGRTPFATDQYPDEVQRDVIDAFTSADLVADINGYSISSQWGFGTSFLYLTNIALARKYGIPYYVFPQSIGPFDYPPVERTVLNPLLRRYFTYPAVVYPRENYGVRELQPYTNDNVERQPDIVLQADTYDLEHIYSEVPEFKEYAIESDSIGIVPNAKLFDRMTDEKLYRLYRDLIETALETGKNVYIFRHSVEDGKHCRRIHTQVDETGVHLIDQDMNAIELERLISQMEFIVASRYHSIIHAYKNDTPAVVIGWAEKYGELLEFFDQLEYYFDGRTELDIDTVQSAVTRMSKTAADSSETIRKRREDIIRLNVFDRTFDVG